MGRPKRGGRRTGPKRRGSTVTEESRCDGTVMDKKKKYEAPRIIDLKTD